MQSRWKLFCALTVGCGVFVTSVESVDARPKYNAVFVHKYAKYFQHGSKHLNCLICHASNSDGKPNTKKRNIYGRVVRKLIDKKNEKDKNKVDTALQKTEREPSAIRGKTFDDLIKVGILPAFGWRDQDGPAVPVGFGSISGQFILDGEIPTADPIVRKGDPNIKDHDCCAAQDLYAEDLVVNPKTKGIRHLFVYLKQVEVIHPDLEQCNEKEVVFDQKACHFAPHTLLIRTDQKVVLKSADPIVHNVHWFSLRNSPFNVLIAPNDRQGLVILSNRKLRAERLPTAIRCDIHPWMKAYWLLSDHPYMAITDEDGKFSLEKVPEGEHDLIVWHERIGYLDARKDDSGNYKWQVQLDRVNWVGPKCTVSVQADKTTEFGALKIPHTTFQAE